MFQSYLNCLWKAMFLTVWSLIWLVVNMVSLNSNLLFHVWWRDFLITPLVATQCLVDAIYFGLSCPFDLFFVNLVNLVFLVVM
jgi:hypothetical protein